MKRPSAESSEDLKSGCRLRVAAADFVRNVGHWQSEALQEPISITYHGRVRLMLATPEHFSAQPKEAEEEAETFRREAYAHRAMTVFSTIGIVQLNPDRTIAQINVIAGNILGHAHSAMAGRRLSEFLPPAGATVYEAKLEASAREGGPADMTIEIPGPTTRYLWVKVFPTGAGFEVFIKDQTSDMRFKQDAESYQALSNAIAAMGDIAELRVDRRGRVISATDALTDLIGLTPNEVIDIRVMDIVKIGDKRQLHLAVEAASFKGESSQFAIALMAKDGQEKQARVVVTSIFEDAAPAAACLLITLEAEEKGRGAPLREAAAPYAS
jgi:PAS domain S-box-containing protein